MKNIVTQPRVLAKIPSKTNPTKEYEIRLGADGVVYCTCRAWITNKFCKHLEEYHSRNTASSLPAISTAATNTVLKFFQDQAENLSPKKEEQIQNTLIYNTVKYGIIEARWNLLTTTRVKGGLHGLQATDSGGQAGVEFQCQIRKPKQIRKTRSRSKST